MPALVTSDYKTVSATWCNVTLDPMTFVEREALRWVQKYIGAFGGDPSKVTMYVLQFLTRWISVPTFCAAGERVLEPSQWRCTWLQMAETPKIYSGEVSCKADLPFLLVTVRICYSIRISMGR